MLGVHMAKEKKKAKSKKEAKGNSGWLPLLCANKDILDWSFRVGPVVSFRWSQAVLPRTTHAAAGGIEVGCEGDRVSSPFHMYIFGPLCWYPGPWLISTGTKGIRGRRRKRILC